MPKPAQSGQPIPPGEQSQPKKSEVSLVYELALKRNLTVQFEKISEEGPPHLKHYSIRLHVGNPEEQEDNEQYESPSDKYLLVNLELHTLLLKAKLNRKNWPDEKRPLQFWMKCAV